MIVYLGNWFRVKDRAKAVALFMSAISLAMVIGGPVSGALLEITWLGLEGWRWLFILEGMPAIVLGITSWFFLTERPEDARAQGGAESILLVDDSPEILSTLAELLDSEGAQVTAAEGGVLGLELASQTRFDLILSDIGMPEMDGHQMLMHIRADTPNRSTPSIALTGYGTLRDVEKAKAAGFDLHLRKPIDLQTLIDMVRQATMQNRSG